MQLLLHVYVQATSFDGVFLLVAFHCTALVCNYCFIAVNKKSIYLFISLSINLSIYLSIYSSTVSIYLCCSLG